jgi:hypothetical protein
MSGPCALPRLPIPLNEGASRVAANGGRSKRRGRLDRRRVSAAADRHVAELLARWSSAICARAASTSSALVWACPASSQGWVIAEIGIKLAQGEGDRRPSVEPTVAVYAQKRVLGRGQYRLRERVSEAALREV